MHIAILTAHSTEIDATSSEERPTEQTRCLKCLKRYCIGCCVSWFKRTRRRSWLELICILALFGCLLDFILSRRLQDRANSLSLDKIPYHSSDLRVPHYLLLNIDDDSQPKYNQIFENIIPHNLRPNITDQDLVKSLFDNKLNLAYVIHTRANEVATSMQGKLCSNASNEWILMTFEKEYLDENAYGIEVSSDKSQKRETCSLFDFKKCTLSNLHNNYPRLFQFDYAQHIRRTSSNKRGSIRTDIARTMYYYNRRRAADYLQYKEELTKIPTTSLNMTIMIDSITSRQIRIRVKMTENNVFLTNMDCLATLQNKYSHPIQSLQMIGSVIQFDQLSSLTSCNICISCVAINKICKQIKTAKGSPFASSAEPYIWGLVLCFALVTMIVFAVSLNLSRCKSFLAWFCHRQPVILPSEDDQVYQLISANATNNGTTNTNEDGRSGSIRSQAGSAVSLSTIDGERVVERWGSISSINLA